MEEAVLDKGLDTDGKLKPIEQINGRWHFLWISVALAILPMMVEVWLIVQMMGIFNDILSGTSYRALELMSLAKTEENILVFYYVLTIVSIVAVCMWVHRANKNMGTAGMKGIEQSPGMAVGWFFIPVANWFMPFNVMKEIDRGSQSISKPEEHKSWSNNKPQSLLYVWFFMYAISAVFLLYLTVKTRMMQDNGASLENMKSFVVLCYMYIVAYTLRIISGISLIIYTRKITQFHNNHIELTTNG